MRAEWLPKTPAECLPLQLELQDQKQDQDPAAGAAAPVQPVENSAIAAELERRWRAQQLAGEDQTAAIERGRTALKGIAFQALKMRPAYLEDEGEWSEEIKRQAARAGIAYDARTVGPAQRAAEARYRKTSGG